MYVFRDYNQRHAGQILTSIATYFIILGVACTWTFLLGSSTARFFSVALAGLLIAHVVRIYQLRACPGIRMNASQNMVSAGAAIFAALLIGYAYVGVSDARVLDMSTFRVVVLPFALATFFSIWVDFFVAQMLAKPEQSFAKPE